MSELFHTVNWVDVVALILLIKITYTSSQIGVGRQILPLILLALIFLITVYSYSDIAAFFIERYSFRPSVCRFFTYFFMVLAFGIIYRVISRVTGLCLFHGEAKGGAIEKIGGAFLGLLRSIFIIGILMVCLLLTPAHFIEQGAVDSYSAPFFIEASLWFYNTVIDRIFKDEATTRRKTLSQLLSKKEEYIFKTLDLREKSRFFKEDYNY